MEHINWLNALSIFVSAVLGSVIGIERQVHDKPAGLRTNILISIGACVFTIISKELVTNTGDPSRIAAGIVTGVGFLGAGSIIRGEGGIHGLTSAAGIWIVAAIGMACGAQMYSLAVFATVVATIVLIVLPPVTKKLSKELSGREEKAKDSER